MPTKADEIQRETTVYEVQKYQWLVGHWQWQGMDGLLINDPVVVRILKEFTSIDVTC